MIDRSHLQRLSALLDVALDPEPARRRWHRMPGAAGRTGAATTRLATEAVLRLPAQGRAPDFLSASDASAVRPPPRRFAKRAFRRRSRPSMCAFHPRGSWGSSIIHVVFIQSNEHQQFCTHICDQQPPQERGRGQCTAFILAGDHVLQQPCLAAEPRAKLRKQRTLVQQGCPSASGNAQPVLISDSEYRHGFGPVRGGQLRGERQCRHASNELVCRLGRRQRERAQLGRLVFAIEEYRRGFGLVTGCRLPERQRGARKL